MADRFPLIVNSLSQKIEELISGDNLELTGNNIVIGGDTGSGKYLTSDGSVVSWGVPGDVYVAQSQTLTNKTLESATISGSLNTITNLPNTALVNSSISVNGVATPLGGSVTTPNDDTTYAVSMSDGASASIKKLILTAGGSGSGTDEVSFGVGTPNSIPSGSNAIVLAIDRVDDAVTISGTAPDSDTVTTLQSATGGTAQSGDIIIAATGSSTVSQNAANKTITIDSSYVDTITKIRATTGQVLNPGNFTFLSSGATSVAQGVDGNGDSTVTYSSTDTVTRLKGGSAGSLVSGDVTVTGGNNVTVSQNQQTITIDSVDTDTITRLATGNNAVLAGDFKFVATGATSISQNTAAGVTTFTITSVNDDTGASLTASSGIILSSNDFQLKNAANFSGNTLLKWDSGNNQIGNSLITDNGSTVTITGDLVVDGTQTVLNTTTLTVEDNSIELRKGNSLVGTDGGVQLNLETDGSGSVTKYQSLQWYNAGGYWRGWDGSLEKRFVTEAETQVLTNKTLTSPTLTAPSIGAAVATSINGLAINSTASATLDIATSKTLDVNDSLTLSSDNPTTTVSVNLRQGGDVAFRSDTLASFSSTTSTQMRGLITDTTGLDKLVFQTNPTLLTGITTTSAGFNLINSGATSIQFGGAASSITIGATTGDTTFNHDVILSEDLTVGVDTNDNTVFNGNVNIENVDLIIRGTSLDPMSVGRGGGAVNSNTRVGVSALAANTSGSQNTALGYQALLTNNIGASNTAVGNRALRIAGVANNNIAIGKDVMLVTLSGSKNVAIGNNAMESNQTGNANVCIGHYAGYDILGDGNVLIGPADNETSADVTFRPPNISGDRQLVIGSGGQAWIRGDSNYDVTLSNDFTVNGSALIKGDLVINGTTTTVKSNIVQITDKAIELAAVVSTTFGCTVVSGSANITSIAPTLGLIPGMVVTSNTAGITVPTGTIIVSIATNGTAVLSNNVTGSGTPTFSAIGPSDTAAEDGGIIVKGNTDKTFLWRGVDGGVTYNSWLSSEHIDVASGKNYYVNGIMFASDTNKVIGPTNGGGQGETTSNFTLGSAVTSCSLGSFTAAESIFDNNVAIGGTHPWAVTGGDYNNLSISGNTNASAGFLNLGAGATVTNADFDLGRIRFWNNATEVSQIAGTTGDSNNDTGRLSFSTKANTGSLTERLRIGHDGKTKLITALTTDYLEYGNNPRLWLKCPDGINGLRIDASTTPLEIKNSSNSGKSVSVDSSFNFNVNGDYELATNDFDSSGKIFLNATRNNGSSTVTAFQTSIQAVANSNANNDGYLGLGASATPDDLKIYTNGTISFGPGLLEENFVNDTGGGIQANYIHHIMTYGEVFYGVTNAVANFTFDVVGNGSTDYDDITTINKVSTVTIYVTANSKYMTEFRIDGTAKTVKWAGGSAPSSGSASGVDVYSMTIMKTAADTYHVFGNVTNFA